MRFIAESIAIVLTTGIAIVAALVFGLLRG